MIFSDELRTIEHATVHDFKRLQNGLKAKGNRHRKTLEEDRRILGIWEEYLGGRLPIGSMLARLSHVVDNLAEALLGQHEDDDEPAPEDLDQQLADEEEVKVM